MAKTLKKRERLVDRIGVRISASDRVAFELAACVADRSLSDWVVQVCRAAAKKGVR